MDMSGLRAEVVQALNSRSWPPYVAEKLGPLVGDVVGPLLRPVVGARKMGRSTPAEVGCSKVGGRPHVDEAFVWPTEDDTDEPLALVCQVNLAEVATASRGALTATGMLYLFSIYDGDRAYGYEIDDSTAKIIHVPMPGPLAKAKRPDGLDDDGVFKERRLVLGPSLVCEEADGDGRPCAVRFDYSVESAIDEVLAAHGGGSDGVLRLLGNPHLHGEYRNMVDPITDTLLLYVDGYAAAKNAFGEGSFHVLIGKADLASGQLDQASVTFTPGT